MSHKIISDNKCADCHVKYKDYRCPSCGKVAVVAVQFWPASTDPAIDRYVPSDETQHEFINALKNMPLYTHRGRPWRALDVYINTAKPGWKKLEAAARDFFKFEEDLSIVHCTAQEMAARVAALGFFGLENADTFKARPFRETE
jgi:hypothetical protein